MRRGGHKLLFILMRKQRKSFQKRRVMGPRAGASLKEVGGASNKDRERSEPVSSTRDWK